MNNKFSESKIIHKARSVSLLCWVHRSILCLSAAMLHIAYVPNKFLQSIDLICFFFISKDIPRNIYYFRFNNATLLTCIRRNRRYIIFLLTKLLLGTKRIERILYACQIKKKEKKISFQLESKQVSSLTLFL